MKKVLVFIMFLLFTFAVLSPVANAASLEKVKAYAQSLEVKLAESKAQGDTNRVNLLEGLINDAKSRIVKMEKAGKTKEDGKKVEGLEKGNHALQKQIDELKEEVTDAIAALNSQIKGTDKVANKGATVAGRAYIYYQKDLLDDSVNKFDISRVYLDYKKKLNQDTAVRFTTDIGRETYVEAVDFSGQDVDTDTRMQVYLKYAYFDIGGLNVPYIGLQTLRVGQSATHWIDFMQKNWKFRYVAKTMTDKYKLFSSADLGLAALGTLDFADFEIPYLNKVSYHALLMNGSGYKKAESNGGKDIGLTLKTEPVRWGKKDYITTAVGFLVEDVPLSSLDTSGLAKKATAMVSYAFSKPAKGIAYAEYANQLESTNGGLSVGGQYQVCQDTNAFARIDNYKKSGSDYVLRIAGVEYNWGKNVKLALDYQHETKNSADNSKKVAIHTRIKW
ncbi:MAG: hypothetical protein U9R38_03895 [Candidatus Margulisiibacteriota bacterium]|nr:hypothetical protein [Candidatus Margulisiibacteriota bacterium]